MLTMPFDRQRSRHGIFLLAAGLALFGTAGLQAQTPAGSYQKSCQSISFSKANSILRASCKANNGDWHATALNTSQCTGDIFNDADGNLRCTTAPVKGGSYQKSCRDETMQGTVLEASCKADNGQWHLTKLDTRSCVGDIFNDAAGDLRCSTAALMPGSYQKTCRDAVMQGTTLTASCKDNKGNWQAARLPDANRCKGDIINDPDGHLDCSTGPLPGGSYQLTCRYMTIDNGTLHAFCKDRSGNWDEASLANAGACKIDISNYDGGLFCGDGFDVITHVAREQTDIWRIDRPRVTQRITGYPQILFRDGDNFTVKAGGCVQSGGHGNTWHLYVDPRGNQTQNLYHGLIWVPGATSHLMRVAGMMQGVQAVRNTGPAFAPHLFLRLGYEDDDYTDNGYYKHDDGDGDQCKGVGPAFVEIAITHGDPRAPVPAREFRPLDLINNSFDGNLIFHNPRWNASVRNPSQIPDPVDTCGSDLQAPNCTTQAPSLDVWGNDTNDNLDPLSDIGVFCPGNPRGHINWEPVTYEGTISWHSHDSEEWGDDDYNWELVPAVTNAGLITGNGGSLHLEFNAEETVNRFREAWWVTLHSLVDETGDWQRLTSQPTPAQLDNWVSHKRAIVTGLLGIDAAHSGASSEQAEIHPVYALVIESNADPVDNLWAIFVRNSGNEGFCSGETHYLDTLTNTYVMSIPWLATATGVKVLPSTQFMTYNNQIPFPDIRVVGTREAHTAVQLTFKMPDPEQDGHIDGELHLQWTLPASSAAPESREIRKAPVARSSEPEDEDEPEAGLKAALLKMTPAQRQVYVSEMRRTAPAAEKIDQPEPLRAGAAAPAATAPAVRPAPPARSRNLTLRQRAALCTAFGNQKVTFGGRPLDCTRK